MIESLFLAQSGHASASSPTAGSDLKATYILCVANGRFARPISAVEASFSSARKQTWGGPCWRSWERHIGTFADMIPYARRDHNHQTSATPNI
jgi:hypothetical protein